LIPLDIEDDFWIKRGIGSDFPEDWYSYKKE